MQDYLPHNQLRSGERPPVGMTAAVLAVLMSGAPPVGLILGGIAIWRGHRAIQSGGDEHALVRRARVALGLGIAAVLLSLATGVAYWVALR